MPTIGLPKYRVTYHFNDESEGGWSESYWMPGTTFVGVETSVAAILTARLALLTNEWRCVYNVTHDTTQKGTARTDAALLNLVGTYALAAGKANLPTDDCLLVNFEGASTRKNKKYLHGLTTAKIEDGIEIADATWDANFASYGEAIQTYCVNVNKNYLEPGTHIAEAITTVYSRGLSNHQIGRPFGSRRGRRSPIKLSSTRVGKFLVQSGVVTQQQLDSGREARYSQSGGTLPQQALRSSTGSMSSSPSTGG